MCRNIAVRGESVADNLVAWAHARSGNPREVRRRA
jgi:hypothetical protein